MHFVAQVEATDPIGKTRCVMQVMRAHSVDIYCALLQSANTAKATRGIAVELIQLYDHWEKRTNRLVTETQTQMLGHLAFERRRPCHIKSA